MKEYPELLAGREEALIQRRRVVALDYTDEGVRKGNVGLAMSGGGVRSAVNCLGSVQSLVNKDALKQFDFLSTVSGGGYTGGFVGRMIEQHGHDELKVKLANDSGHMKYLRNSGNYLAPNGQGDMFKALAGILRNWVTMLLLMSVLFATAFAGLRCITSFFANQYVIGSVTVSSGFLPLGLLLLALIPLGWAYWTSNFKNWSSSLLAVAVFGGSLGMILTSTVLSPYLLAIPGVVAALSLLYAGIARLYGLEDGRKILNDFLGWSFYLFVIFSGIVLVDSIGYFLFMSMTETQVGALGGLSSVIMGLFGIRKKLSDSGGIVSKLVVPAMVFGLFAVLLSTLSAGSFFLGPWAWVGFLALSGITLVIGFSWELVNRSSQNELFASRIIRSFLGASNDARVKEGKIFTHVHEDDDVNFTDYKPYENGGPLHLVNVTVNETVDGRSKLHQTSRMGIPMAIGPAGVSVASRHHASWIGDKLSPINIEGKRYHAFGSDFITPESLTLGRWISISAAAVSTAMGDMTSMTKSLLLGLLNIRLGYWWNSGVGRPSKSIFGVQRAMLKEYFAAFPGTADRRWYLSDGGHFENTAAYELIRRRVPVIVVLDNGCDPDYKFEGLSVLVRKARIDFGAHISFLNSNQLDEVLDGQMMVKSSVRGNFNSLKNLGRKRDSWDGLEVAKGNSSYKVNSNNDPYSLGHAALARVTWDDSDDVSWIVYMKPTLMGDEPMDLKNYRSLHPDFPHETTADQFFGEDQWESYRRLSQHASDKVFQEGGQEGNTPLEWIVNGKGPDWSPGE